jgi:hypothetical protein
VATVKARNKPSKLDDPKTQRLMLDAVGRGLSYEAAAKLAGVTGRTLGRYRTTNKAFAQKLAQARDLYMTSGEQPGPVPEPTRVDEPMTRREFMLLLERKAVGTGADAVQAMAMLTRLHAEELRAEVRVASRPDQSPATEELPATTVARPRGMAVLALPPIEDDEAEPAQSARLGS